ncbi:MAG TPA: EAL domain-containing protein [Smithellaceae bacterium]|jgi:diguanylate cyclase (GGDEF)-like protein|nr:EAL domain-containing protein [Syntrophaceae bacterium]NMD05695.1 EAL domain-containing protein [Deltaproteobacteria bacterium]HOC61345.1 EAL domain-containing protein [Smithellaceae bacterium]HOU52172.1 EAL domain-containing protein [Smithella sp.]MBP8609024.1 EAL domain-containing protein [Syntrophaceae bacterium]
MPLPNLISLLFFLAMVVYFFLGVYVIRLNFGSVIHRLFFCICLTLCIWSLSFSIANSAMSYEMSLTWRRIGAIGWGTLYSFLLHYTLCLTGKQNVLKKRWIYALIYLPAILNIFVFSLYGDLALKRYVLEYTYAGWVNVRPASAWDAVFNVYYAVFSLIVIGLFFHWGWSSKERVIKKQAYLIIVSYAVALVVGTMTEFVINYYFPFKFPQLAPLIILIPIATMYYCIAKYGLMAPKLKNTVPQEGQILSEASQSELYQYLTVAYILSAFLHFAIETFIQGSPLITSLPKTLLLIVLGLALQIIQKLNIQQGAKDLLLNVLVILSIPLIVLSFVSDHVTFWSLPLIFVMVSILFRQKRLLYVVSLVTFLTLLWIWITVPEQTVKIDASNHIFRIGIFGVLIWIAFYINRIYFNRLAKNEEQVKHQSLLADISAQFVDASQENIDKIINDMLRQCGRHFQADRAGLFMYSGKNHQPVHSHEWCNDGIASTLDSKNQQTVLELPGVKDQIDKAGYIHVSDAETLQPGAIPDKDSLKDKQIQSLIIVALTGTDNVIGYIFFEAIQSPRKWDQDHREIIQVLGNLLSDALRQVEAEKAINYMAYYDALTALPNRALLTDRLKQAISLAMRTEKLISIIFIDVDSFKSVNDTMGHDGGDAMLMQIAERLSACVRQYDSVARFGGDEFLVMLQQIPDIKYIGESANKIMSVFNEPITIKGQEFFITASAGVAVFPFDGEDADELIKNADMAMYAAKSTGKNKVTFCSAEMKKEVLDNMELTNSLYRAVGRNELFLLYQPQVNPDTIEIIGLEALIRWRHPVKGIIPPTKFIPIAEKTSLIHSIGEWVLMTACRQNMEWQNQGLKPTRIAVNLSVKQFHSPNIVNVVDRVLRETKLMPCYLELEVTESLGTHDKDYVINTMNKLKALGLSLSIDDFGTDYSSLGRLKDLPVDRIKIDMQFIRGIAKNAKDEGIIKIILQLGKTLGLHVVAEGVETQQQLAFLKDNLCFEIQGFYFHKPVVAEDIVPILRRQEKGNH